MKIEEMIEEMNKATDGTLAIIHYCNWELHSYKDDSLFSPTNCTIQAESFKDLVEKGYKILKDRRMDERI